MGFQFQKAVRFNLDVDFQKVHDTILKDISEIYEELSWDVIYAHFADNTVYYLEKLLGIEFGYHIDGECGEKFLFRDNEEVIDCVTIDFYSWLKKKYEPKK